MTNFITCKCRDCGYEYEKPLLLFKDGIETCPLCGKGGIHRIFKPSNIIINGIQATASMKKKVGK